jgi:hypothetical protein
MAWDPALLRKFNATGHFRLLNQVRSELKANPIKRAAPSAADQANSRGVATGKPLDLRSQGYGRRRSTGSGSSASGSSGSGASGSGSSGSGSPGQFSSAALATPLAPLPVAPLPDTAPVPAAEPSPWGKRKSSPTAAPASSPIQGSADPTEGTSPLDDSAPAEAGSRSFRDRLNAIQMR